MQKGRLPHYSCVLQQQDGGVMLALRTEPAQIHPAGEVLPATSPRFRRRLIHVSIPFSSCFCRARLRVGEHLGANVRRNRCPCSRMYKDKDKCFMTRSNAAGPLSCHVVFAGILETGKRAIGFV